MRKLLILSVLSVFAFACTQEEEKEMIEVNNLHKKVFGEVTRQTAA